MKRTKKVEDAYNVHYDWLVHTTEEEIEELVDLGSLRLTREEFKQKTGSKFNNKYQEDYYEYD